MLQEQVKGKKFRRILLTRCQKDFEKSLPERMAEIDQGGTLSQVGGQTGGRLHVGC